MLLILPGLNGGQFHLPNLITIFITRSAEMAGTGNNYTRQKIQPGNRLVKCALSLIKIMVHKQCR